MSRDDALLLLDRGRGEAIYLIDDGLGTTLIGTAGLTNTIYVVGLGRWLRVLHIGLLRSLIPG